ncbi:MAG TPA: branched-chain amino acid ABC transporter permease [Stellaceae bacterium]|nr:branched-chain amino acid ABC transporter permease [Stellaceae bacterium]
MPIIQGIVQVVFDGIAFGMLLFVMSVGLSITLGMMHFANLAHGVFAMLGGYVTASLMHRAGWPFLATLPMAFIVIAAVSVPLERYLYRRMYQAKELDQVLLTVGIIYMAIAGAAYVWGPEPMNFTLPDWLTVYRQVGWFSFSTYGALLLALGTAITLAIFFGLERTRFGAMIRAAVDDRRVALGVGIDVNRVFTITFAIGSGLAGLGGALGINALGLDPSFPIEYLVFFLIVVSIGGGGTVKGALAAALLLGLSDTAGKYYVPQTGAFIIYVVMLLVMLWRPNGLFGRP